MGNRKEMAEQKFHEVAEAYEVLSDPKARKMYDRFGKKGFNSGGGNGVGGGSHNFEFKFKDAQDLFKDAFKDQDMEEMFRSAGANAFNNQGNGNDDIQFDFNIDLGDIGGFGNMGDINLADMMKGAFGSPSPPSDTESLGQSLQRRRSRRSRRQKHSNPVTKMIQACKE